MIKNRKFMLMTAIGLILCLLISVSLTACGSKTETPAEEEPAAEEQQASEPEAAEPEATEPEAADTESSGDEMIGEEKALEIAIKDAGVNKDDVTLSIVELDTDDDTGKQEYEIQFNVGATEYEYNVDPYTGKILEKDIDNDND